MEWEQHAFAEIKILNDIVSLQETVRQKIRNWAITLVSAVSVAYLSKDIEISTHTYIIVCYSVLVLFLWADVIHRVAQSRAIKRTVQVEDCFSGQTQYDGPKIATSLSPNSNIRDQWHALNNVRIYSVYIILAILATVLSICK